MKFYGREKELELLKKADRLKENHSILTILIGRRRIGKTTLALQNYSNDVVLYFFVSKKDERLLCEEFLEEVFNKLGEKPFGLISRFEKLFEYILEIGKTKKFTLIIDEFQEFYRTNPAIYSSIQKLWDIYKNKTHIHLVGCGSAYSLMKEIFENNKEPLFGRADFKIELKPLGVRVIKDILEGYNAYTPENLLDFYLLTGGVAKYIELFALYEAFDFKTMIDNIIQPNSLFLDEGKNRLVEEFGKEYWTYFSILSLIASSKTSRAEIESILERNISGHLTRLENDYNIIKSVKPINAKTNSKVQKYEIVDNFLSFWFRFIYKYQSLVEAENFNRLKEIINRDILVYKGRFLENLFADILKEQERFTKIGSYWERNNQNEIDIVAIDDIDKKILICEVKLNEKKLDLNDLVKKSQKLIKDYSAYRVEYKLLSIDNINKMIGDYPLSQS